MTNNMYLVYIDESFDETHYAYSAIFINAFNWNDIFKQLVDWRMTWFQDYNIPLDYELHATKFVGGRGLPVPRSKDIRADLFYKAIGFIEGISDIQIINAITPAKGKHLQLFEYMLNRINRTLQAKQAIGILICDEGNENKLTAKVRQMKKLNQIPNDFSYYPGGSRNIPLNNIIEDPLFKTSKSSYLIQLADFVAFSLLRNEKPLLTTQQKVKDAFEQLDKVLVKRAFSNDPSGKGIIRV